jgi:hypothetical protein
MSLLTEALKEIDEWIYNSQSIHAAFIRRGIVNGIRNGLKRQEIDLYTKEVQFNFSDEIHELYQWHDGEIVFGDMANPVCFTPLKNAIRFTITEHVPYRPYLPLFIGDDAFYVIFDASENQKSSPIFFFDGRILPGDSEPSHGDFRSSFYSPSVTCLMQAVAECTKTYDEISAWYMCANNQESNIYLDNTRRHSILSHIYDKYGVIGDCSGLWR